ncbi:MAG: hypothetical protein EA351_13645 [Gemmatimonadales bacterium]|nr:MAG: hypothetical protein EA351_13645 [Gemmatimonadales bacterium]
MSPKRTEPSGAEDRSPRTSLALLLLLTGVLLTLPGPLLGQDRDEAEVMAVASGDSVALTLMHFARTVGDVTVVGQTFFSAIDPAERDTPELVLAPSEFVRITTAPSADSVWVTPVVDGARQSTRMIEAGFPAPSSPGLYEFIVSGQWAGHPDDSRPPSRPAYTGSWALRLIVR